jgi:acetyltransferase AlgX (SGNH hydrolase-like protein)
MARGNGRPSDAQLLSVKLLKDGKVLRGKDGWLFLDGDSNHVLDQHRGELRLSASQVEGWSRLLETRVEVTRGLGSPYHFMVAPNTHAIYDDKLPDDVRTSEIRPVHQIIDDLAEHNSFARVIYPLEELKLAKTDRIVCSRIDSHWNEFGAYVAYERLADVIERYVQMRRLSREDLAFFEYQSVGDLGYKLDPVPSAPITFAYLPYGTSYVVHDNCVEGTGTVIETRCPDAPPTTCVLIGDSYAWYLLRFLSESFRRFVFVQATTVDFEFLAAQSPDMVISVIAERFLIDVPDDETAPSVAEIEYERQAQGRIRPPAAIWKQVLGPPIHIVERMRAQLIADGRLRDATIVSALAYAGIRPRELPALRWHHVGERTLRGAGREIQMIDALVEDFDRWRKAVGEPDPNERVFPGSAAAPWQEGEWTGWQDEVYRPVAEACGLESQQPYALHDIFAWILMSGGAGIPEVAAELGIGKAAAAIKHALFTEFKDLGLPVPTEADVRRFRERASMGMAPPQAKAP